MSDLPPGWEWTTLGEICETALGKMLDRGKPKGHPREPYLRNINVQWDRIDTSNVLVMEIPPDQRDHYSLQQGDVLVCEGGEIGRAAVWEDRDQPYMAFQKALHRVRPLGDISSRFILLSLQWMHESGQLAEISTGSTIKHLPQKSLRELRIVLPPLAEQRRIVDAVDELTSKTRDGRKHLCEAELRTTTLRQSGRLSLLNGVGGRPGRLAEVVERIEAGRSRGGSAPSAESGEWGVIKVSAMTWGEFRAGENKRVPDDFADPRYEIHPGDLLVSRANTADYVGAPVLVGDVRPRLLLSDKSLRIIPKAGTDRRWLLHTFASPEFRSYVTATATGTKDSMRNISQAALLAGPIHLVDSDQQREIADQIDEHIASVKRLDVAVEAAKVRAAQLNRSILAMAFSGRLVDQDADDEPVSILLDRVRAGRAQAGPHPTRRRQRA